MKYMGSKNRIANSILGIVLKHRKPEQFYVEPFFGGGNSMQYVDGNRIAGELNFYIAEMWKSLLTGWMPKEIIKAQYKEIKENKECFPPALVGWTGIACSYCGTWFSGFAGEVNTKGGLRDYQAEAFANVKKQLPKLNGVAVFHSSYIDLIIPDKSIIYCDPPYAGTTKYKDNFDHAAFYKWCRKMVTNGHTVFVSEYSMPNDFICVWEKEVNSSLGANGNSGKNKLSIERLFVHESQLYLAQA